MTNQSALASDPESSPLLEPLLAVHSAPSLAWLADATANAAQRGLGVLYTLLHVTDGSGRLTAVAPASGPQRSVLARLSQTLRVDLTAGKADPALRPRLAEVLEDGRPAVIAGIGKALPQSVDEERLEAVAIELGVTSVIAAPLEWEGERYGLVLLFGGPALPKLTSSAEVLAQHVAVAIANLKEREAGRKHGELDAVRWVYDERRFIEELNLELRRAQRHQRPLSVLLVRILNLDEIRARYGRFLSERVLRQVAGRLDDAMRDTDFLGAAGADGFGAILVEADQEGAAIAENRLLEGIRDLRLPPTVLTDLTVEVGCSTATMPQDGETAEELTAAADARMQRHTIEHHQDGGGHEEAASAG